MDTKQTFVNMLLAKIDIYQFSLITTFLDDYIPSNSRYIMALPK